ncbi:staygreen family protein [Bacillus sp. 31A1R]|uniref:Staygreen family protein n=1 Tax=Robertmurraya mangrovi TaxID=3098077 RepID=A0ABU5IZY5_9BACI|nr:staygreen family protein [Bacillus sp. 31A1R]MDZ5472723.1 staygreen family protein [Bacillus sp. 31A1R]
MSKFNPSKLSATYLPPATQFKPVDERKYTLTHSDETGDLFLTIGYCYDTGAINPKIRDEVLAEWVPQMGQYVLKGKVYISGGEFDEQFSKIRYMIFKKELNLALTAIVYGDKLFYSNYPWLLDSPIYIQFESIFPQYHQLVYFGTPRQYLTAAIQQSVS